MSSSAWPRRCGAAGFDEVKIDGLGNVLGRVGSGRTVIALDGHVDTVGVGDLLHVDA